MCPQRSGTLGRRTARPVLRCHGWKSAHLNRARAAPHRRPSSTPTLSLRTSLLGHLDCLNGLAIAAASQIGEFGEGTLPVSRLELADLASAPTATANPVVSGQGQVSHGDLQVLWKIVPVSGLTAISYTPSFQRIKPYRETRASTSSLRLHLVRSSVDARARNLMRSARTSSV